MARAILLLVLISTVAADTMEVTPHGGLMRRGVQKDVQEAGTQVLYPSPEDDEPYFMQLSDILDKPQPGRKAECLSACVASKTTKDVTCAGWYTCMKDATVACATEARSAAQNANDTLQTASTQVDEDLRTCHEAARIVKCPKDEECDEASEELDICKRNYRKCVQGCIDESQNASYDEYRACEKECCTNSSNLG